MTDEIKIPKRKRGQQRLDCTVIQDEGSWAEISPVKYGESKKLRREMRAAEKAEDEESMMELSDKLLKAHVLSWNFVDDDGKEIPQPPDGLEDLTTAEVNFLSDALLSLGDVDAKN